MSVGLSPVPLINPSGYFRGQLGGLLEIVPEVRVLCDPFAPDGTAGLDTVPPP